jgi:gas vesicle protein
MSEIKYPSSESDNEHQYSADRPWGFLAGLLFGGLAGAGAMLMLAPQSGKRTRVKIQQKSIELRDQATEAVDGAMAQARAKVNQVKDDVRKDAQELKHRGQDVLDESRAHMSAVVDAGKDLVQGA